MGSGADVGVRRSPESYAWPLVAIAVVTVLQVAIPRRDRVGPPLAVPAIEAAAFVVMLIIAARPGPVPARARPLVLVLFGVLVGGECLRCGSAGGAGARQRQGRWCGADRGAPVGGR